MRPLRRPVLTILPFLVPGTAFWTLVITGIATGSAGVWIAAAILGVVTLAGVQIVAAATARSMRSD